MRWRTLHAIANGKFCRGETGAACTDLAGHNGESISIPSVCLAAVPNRHRENAEARCLLGITEGANRLTGCDNFGRLDSIFASLVIGVPVVIFSIDADFRSGEASQSGATVGSVVIGAEGTCSSSN